MKKFTAKLTAGLLTAASLAVSAGAEVYYDVTYPWMDDVYRLDMTEEGGSTEEVTYEEEILCMLGAMSRDSYGKFRPSAKLSKGEYEAALRFVYSGEAVDFAKYDETYKNQKVYQKEIVRGLVGLIENTAIGSDDDIKTLADRHDLLEGVTYAPAKEMTRHEFAVVLWKTLNSEYVQYEVNGEAVGIKVEEGKTVLNGKLDVYEVKGMLNAVHGLNVYGTSSPREGYIEIARAVYKANGIENLDEYLGKTVHAFAKYNKDTEDFELLNIETDKKDESVTFDLTDFEELDGGYLYYDEDGKQRRVNISGARIVLFNGDNTSTVTADMFDGQGTAIIGKSQKGGDYDVVIVKKYTNFLAKKYLENDYELYLAYNAKYKGSYYVDLDPDNGVVKCTVDGVRTGLEKLKSNMAIAMYQNTNKGYTEIIASSEKVKGTVTEGTEDGWVIDGTEYYTDPDYTKLSEDSDTGAQVIKMNSVGTFYVTVHGVLVGFEAEGAAQFGLLKRIWTDDDDDQKIMLRIFNASGEWINYQLAERVEVDGVKNTAEDSVSRIQKAFDTDTTPRPIRFKTADDKIKFIDTLIDDPEEADDAERMKYCGSFSGETPWVKGWDMGLGTDYHVGDSTPMFVIPEDKYADDESKYSISTGSSIPASTKNIVYEAYNADKFKCARLAIYKGSAGNSGTEQYIYIKDVTTKVVGDEVVTGVNCWLFTRNKQELDEKFYEIPDDWKTEWGVTDLKNMFVGAYFDGAEISGLKLEPGYYVKDFKIEPNEQGEELFFDRISSRNLDMVSGIVIDTDPSRDYMLINCGADGEKSVINTACVIGRVDTKATKLKVEGITTAEINPGDRVFYWGSLRRAYYVLVMSD